MVILRRGIRGRRHRGIAVALVMAGIGLSTGPATAQDDAADPETTRRVLSIVLAAANEPLPVASACLGDYGQQGPARIRDLLSMQLAYVYHGESVIRGSCEPGRGSRCRLTISRAFGDDVASLSLAFDVREHKLVPSSLRCTSTP